MAESAIPTYRTAADVLSKQTGSGLRLAGWTVARTILIAPPFLLLLDKSQHRRVWIAATASSVMISVFALLRIFDAKTVGLGRSRCLNGRGRRQLRCGS